MSLPLVLDAASLGSLLAEIQSQGITPSQANLCLVDLRSADAYAESHLPGAVHADATRLNRVESPAGGLIPDADAINALLADIGANLGDLIIAYDAGRDTAAARLMWVIDAYGYEVGSWLNGGFAAWQKAGLALTQEVPGTQAGNLSLSLIGDNIISTEGLMARLGAENQNIVDTRSAAEFAGTDVRAAFGGHIPGAKHLEWTDLLDDDGLLLDDHSLQTKLDALGLEHEATTIIYCQTHQRSSVTYVALRHLGYTDVRALDGAWSNWGNREDTPKEATLILKNL